MIAWNDAADRLFGFAQTTQTDRNIMRMIFANPDLRARLPDWNRDAPKLLAQFCGDLASAPDDPAMLDLVAELKAVSPQFRRWIEERRMEGYLWGIGALLDAAGRRCGFAHEMLIVDQHRHLRMIAYFPED
ncbi:MAG: hypothetical protein Q4G36_07660 [Paracoccus sp. (in: a-proteobacteria)]|nr:hypothetical protein [Paracoccus sp. (in: a-proteobacteria)]